MQGEICHIKKLIATIVGVLDLEVKSPVKKTRHC